MKNTAKYLLCGVTPCILMIAFVGCSGEGRAVGRETATVNPDLCWKKSSGRGIGTIPGSCTEDKKGNKLEKQGLLCYPQCKAGYTGLLFVCWQDCPEGFTNHGAFCRKPESHSRGSGYAVWNKDKCENENGAECDRCLLQYYPKCEQGFHSSRWHCDRCSPDCPEGMTDIGISCLKDSYTRKTILPGCEEGKVYDAGLCYRDCSKGSKGVGPVCWKKCPKGMEDCGALCGISKAACAGAVAEEVAAVGTVAKNIAEKIAALSTGGVVNPAAVTSALGTTASTVSKTSTEQKAGPTTPGKEPESADGGDESSRESDTSGDTTDTTKEEVKKTEMSLKNLATNLRKIAEQKGADIKNISVANLIT